MHDSTALEDYDEQPDADATGELELLIDNSRIEIPSDEEIPVPPSAGLPPRTLISISNQDESEVELMVDLTQDEEPLGPATVVRYNIDLNNDYQDFS